LFWNCVGRYCYIYSDYYFNAYRYPAAHSNNMELYVLCLYFWYVFRLCILNYRGGKVEPTYKNTHSVYTLYNSLLSHCVAYSVEPIPTIANRYSNFNLYLHISVI